MSKVISKGYTREFLAVEKEFTPESEFFEENGYQAICRLCKWDGNEYYEDYDLHLCEFFNFAEYEDSGEVVAKSFEEIEKVCPHFSYKYFGYGKKIEVKEDSGVFMNQLEALLKTMYPDIERVRHMTGEEVKQEFNERGKRFSSEKEFILIEVSSSWYKNELNDDGFLKYEDTSDMEDFVLFINITGLYLPQILIKVSNAVNDELSLEYQGKENECNIYYSDLIPGEYH